MVVVSIKYVVLILRADNNGEGGLIAMLALASTAVKDRPALRRRLLLLGIFGTAIFFGDGVITPAISVFGRSKAWRSRRRRCTPSRADHAGRADVAVLFQRHGTARHRPLLRAGHGVLVRGARRARRVHIATIRRCCGRCARTTGSLHVSSHRCAFIALGAVVFASPAPRRCTPTWATSASGRSASRGSASSAGAGDQLFRPGRDAAREPRRSNPFYEMAPAWALYPLIGARHRADGDRLAGADHRRVLGHQAGDPARLPAAAASHAHVGPGDRADLRAVHQLEPVSAASLLAVVLFGSSNNLASAYGIAVTIDMLITTTMTFFVIRYGWKYPWALSLAATGFFFLVDFIFLARTSSRCSTAAGSRCSSAP